MQNTHTPLRSCIRAGQTFSPLFLFPENTLYIHLSPHPIRGQIPIHHTVSVVLKNQKDTSPRRWVCCPSTLHLLLSSLPTPILHNYLLSDLIPGHLVSFSENISSIPSGTGHSIPISLSSHIIPPSSLGW